MVWNGLPILIAGTGGISKEVNNLISENLRKSNIKEFDVLGYISDDNEEKSEYGNNRITVACSDSKLSNFAKMFPVLGIVIPVGNPDTKKAIYDKISSIPNVVFPNIISYDAYVNYDKVKMGFGNIITSGSKITCDVKLGNFNLINLNSTIGHDVDIASFNTINPLVSISGNVKLGSQCMLGTGANILQGIKIGDKCTIGAGAVVVRNVVDSTTVIGVPAKVISKE